MKLKTDADFERGLRDPGEKSVIESCASTKSASFSGKSQPGHNDEVQLLPDRARHRLADPKSPRYKFRKRRDWAKRKSVAFAPRIADRWILEQAKIPQKIQVRFSQRRREQGETLLPEKEGVKIFADPQGSPVSFALRQLLQAFAHRIPQARFIGKL